MAYQGGGIRQIWMPDLSTRVGAQSAMDSAKFGFLILAGFRILVFGFAAVAARADLAAAPEAAAGLAGVALFQIGLPCSRPGASTSTRGRSRSRSRPRCTCSDSSLT